MVNDAQNFIIYSELKYRHFDQRFRCLLNANYINENLFLIHNMNKYSRDKIVTYYTLAAHDAQ